MDFDDAMDGDVGQSIADAAKSMVGNGSYGLYRYSNSIPSGTPKDDAFVNTVLTNSGNGFSSKPPGLADWTDPNVAIPGFVQVAGPPQAGDVLAAQTPIRMDDYSPNGQSLGIATGNGTSIGVHAGQQIAENTFGHEDGHDPIIRRAADAMGTQLSDWKSSFCKPDDGKSAFGGAGETGASGFGSSLAEWGAKKLLPNLGVAGRIAATVGGGVLGQSAYRSAKDAICAPDDPGPTLTYPMPPLPPSSPGK